MKRVPPSVRLKEEIEGLLEGWSREGGEARLVQQVFLAPTYAAALKRGRDLITKFKDRYPAALECSARDLESA